MKSHFTKNANANRLEHCSQENKEPLTLSSPLQKVEEAIGTTGNIRKLKKHSHLEEVDETLTHEEVEEELALTLTIGEYQPDKY